MLVVPSKFLEEAEKTLLVANSPRFVYSQIAKLVDEWRQLSVVECQELRSALTALGEEKMYAFKVRAKAYLLIVATLEICGELEPAELGWRLDNLKWGPEILHIHREKHPASITSETITFRAKPTSAATSTVIKI